MKYSSALDVTKYFLALVIVAIHTDLYPDVLYPWLRLAIPLFFIISSYLLFIRINSSQPHEKFDCIKTFVKRNLQLYLFWFVVLLPITVYVREAWYVNGLWHFIKTFISHVLFTSTFPASWYIVASIWAVLILYSTRKVNSMLLCLLALVVYVACCMRSGYYFYFKNFEIYGTINQYYDLFFTNPVFSFPVAAVWMFVGKLFADHKDKTFNKPILCVLIPIFSVCLWFEWKTSVAHGGAITSDCFFFLAPVSICIFALIKDARFYFSKSKMLRTISVVMYPLHASLTYIMPSVLSRFNVNHPLVNFFVIVVICHILTILILRLEKLKLLRFLKYSH